MGALTNHGGLEQAHFSKARSGCRCRSVTYIVTVFPNLIRQIALMSILVYNILYSILEIYSYTYTKEVLFYGSFKEIT